MKARIRNLRVRRDIEKDNHKDSFIVGRMYSKGIFDFLPYKPYSFERNVKNWYTHPKTGYNYHISWLIPVEENGE